MKDAKPASMKIVETEKIVKNQEKKRRMRVVRLGLAILYLGLGAAMMLSGRSHTVLIDNKGADDGSYEALDGILVSVDGKEGLEYYPGDRDKALVQGQRHRIRVELFSDGTITEKTFKVAFGESLVLLSVPKMVKGIEPFVERFVPLVVAPLPGDSSEMSGYTSPEAVLPVQAPIEAVPPAAP
jgi:hypothetical protein